MNANAESMRARRYLMGDASDEESAAIEQEYLEHEDAVDRIAAAEDDLIEDYLADQLAPSDRDRFERGYLSVPRHRVRVETIRRLMAQASPMPSAIEPLVPPRHDKRSPVSPVTVRRFSPWLALAATLLIVASVAYWALSPFGRPETATVESRTPPTAPSPVAPREPSPGAGATAPRTFALTISPVAVRGAAETPAVVIPTGTDVVVMRLESDTDSRTLRARRVTVRTVGGDRVWQGPVTTERNGSAGIVGRVDVPAASLPADDYMVTLYGADPAGVEQEWTQYFLRVRGR